MPFRKNDALNYVFLFTKQKHRKSSLFHKYYPYDLFFYNNNCLGYFLAFLKFQKSDVSFEMYSVFTLSYKDSTSTGINDIHSRKTRNITWNSLAKINAVLQKQVSLGKKKTNTLTDQYK